MRLLLSLACASCAAPLHPIDRLLAAARERDAGEVRDLRAEGVPIDVARDGATAVALAVQAQDAGGLEFLLSQGASPNVMLGNEPVLNVASRGRSARVLELLLRYGAHVHLRVPGSAAGRAPVEEAIAAGSLENLTLLLRHGAHLNAAAARAAEASGREDLRDRVALLNYQARPVSPPRQRMVDALNAADAAITAGRPQDALDLMKKHDEVTRYAPAHERILGTALLALGREAEALPHLTRYLELRPYSLKAVDVRKKVMALAAGKALAAANPPWTFRYMCSGESLDECLTQCEAGNETSCSGVGLRHANGDGVPKDEAKAVQYYERACGFGDAGSCYEIGRSYYNSLLGLSRDLAKATHYATLACERADSRACHLQALILLANPTEANALRAAEIYEMYCELGMQEHCATIGWIYLTGYEGAGVIRRDERRGLQLVRTSCDKKDGMGCKLLGDAHVRGLGVAADRRRATELHEQACSLNYLEGCSLAGKSYCDGSGVARDVTRGKGMLDRACKHNFAGSCEAAERCR